MFGYVNASLKELTDQQRLRYNAVYCGICRKLRIRAGQIAVSPAEIGTKWSACTWCEYRSVCQLDPALPGAQKRVLCELSRQELADRLTNQSL